MSKHLDPTLERALNPKDPKKPAEMDQPHVEDEPKINVLIWAVVIIGVLFVAILMIRSVYNPAPVVNTVQYNEWTFTELPDHFWQFQWQQGTAVYHVPLRYNPLQLGNVTMSGTLDAQFGARKQVYIAVDPSNATNQQYVALGVGELSLNLLKVFGVELIASCTRNETASCTSRPIATCASKNQSVIIIREGEGPAVMQQGSCVTVQGEGLEIVQAVDRLLYKFYKVMPDPAR